MPGGRGRLSIMEWITRCKKCFTGARAGTAFTFSALCLIFGCSGKPAPAAPQKSILFIGNSYTDYNGGIDKCLNGLAPNAKVSRIAPGGYYLKSHCNDLRTLEAIRTGKWDFVVLQEQSQAPVVNNADFSLYAGKLADEIRNNHAEIVLFMTWERPDSVQYGVTTENIARAYQALGAKLGAQVAPAGLAFAAALKERPGLVLNSKDGHPTQAGTYLAACVFYGLIYRQSPVGNPYSAGLDNGDKKFLQGIAAEILGLRKAQ